MDTLLFLRQTLESHSPHKLQPHLLKLLPLIIITVNEDWLKIIAESLRVLGAFVIVARPNINGFSNNGNGNNGNNQNNGNNGNNNEGKENEKNESEKSENGKNYDFEKLVLPIFHAILPRLEALDIDQEIKECSISTIGTFFSIFGDRLINGELSMVLGLLKKRLDNENTRLSTLKAISCMAKSNLNLDLNSILNDSTNELSLFLRQKSRGLRQTTLQTLDSLILLKSKSNLNINSNNSNNIDNNNNDQIFSTILHETSGLINDNDLHLTYLALNLILTILNCSTVAVKNVIQYIYPRTIELIASPLLQGK